MSGAVITPSTGSTLARALITTEGDSALLIENGGSLSFSNSWGRSFLKNTMNYTIRKGTTEQTLTHAELNETQKEMSVIMDSISLYHSSLVLEMDETKAPWASTSNFTYTTKGATKVVIPGFKEKRACTVSLTITHDCTFLPCQVIWAGLTHSSIPMSSHSHIVNCFAGNTAKKLSTTSTNLPK
eukprot:TRINITY_DN26102_c0_g1_i1.p1 TRINITY_DN26102_c0_g1~~TRINITY_DN26102_c0_g1_i1.p1  ORF type:complete len:184 (+),score=22.88 TRINITY_DN26102_c0_g1_i1:628-1179(+)